MSETLTFNLEDYRAEDGGILDCWSDLYGEKWIFVTGYDAWHKWTGTHWEKDETQRIRCQIETLMDAMNRAASDKCAEAAMDEAEAKRAKDKDAEDAARAAQAYWRMYVNATKRTKNRVASVEGMAQARRAVAGGALNGGNLLNLRNGTLDLDTLELRPHTHEDHLTYCLEYDFDPNALCPRFGQFLTEVLIHEGTNEADYELIELFQEYLGYSLTTDTQHEAMLWLSGDGGNGKTVAITIVQRLLGPLCRGVDFQTIGQPGNYDMAEIQGRRVILSTESKRGGKVAENHIKQIVSGERIAARPIYGSPMEFKSNAKIWWAMNDKPVITDTSNAFFRRLKLIPFNRTFTDKDKDPALLGKLEGELSGILNFALDGLRLLRERGRLPESKAVADALADYRVESNPVKQWLDERTVAADSPNTLAKVLFEDYQLWAGKNGRQAMNSTNFGKELKRLKIAKRDKTAGACYALGLLADTEAASWASM